ncbi:ATPase, T2SS/T4P/T4SS family [Variovorax sp. UC74_104]|uniref:ATPase, T2SS/T4P/T4SS family n=1 Tax=Variovorax sp. UC74_104 TaxID=3374555 RepID=UPI003757DEBE
MRFESTPTHPDHAPETDADDARAPQAAEPIAVPREQPSSLALFLAPLRHLLDDPEVTEICINEPGAAFVERQSGWAPEALPFASFDWCIAIAKLVANFTHQRISANEPLLSAVLPGGERIQIVLPPATSERTVSITIRRPSNVLWTLEDLESLQIFETTRSIPALPVAQSDAASLVPEERELTRLLGKRQFVSFLRRAVQLRKNILLSGATSSGKTTVAKALILEVPAGGPADHHRGRQGALPAQPAQSCAPLLIPRGPRGKRM